MVLIKSGIKIQEHERKVLEITKAVDAILKVKNENAKLIFAGNIGEAQSFDTLINSALIVKEKGFKINWIILGDGSKSRWLKNTIKTKRYI